MNKTLIAAGLTVVGALAGFATLATYGWARWQDHTFQTEQAEAQKRFQNWTMPTEPADIAAYEHAHGLKLPTGKPIEAYNRWHDKVDIAAIPQPVPFDFCEKRLFGYCVKQKKPSAYVEHLCNTEGGEWYFRKEKDIDRVYVARRRMAPDNLDQTSPYRMEDPWGGAYSYEQVGDLLGVPMDGAGGVSHGYKYIETRKPADHFVDQYGGIKKDNPGSGDFVEYKRLGEFTEKNWDNETTAIEKPLSRFGLTWRGIRRPFDRDHLIAGGELIVYDLATNEVLSVRRGFIISGNVRNYHSKIYWAYAGRCPNYKHPQSGKPLPLAHGFNSTLTRNTLLIPDYKIEQ